MFGSATAHHADGFLLVQACIAIEVEPYTPASRLADHRTGCMPRAQLVKLRL